MANERRKNMKLKKLRGIASLLLAGALLFTSVPASQMPTVVKAAEKWEEVDNPTLRDYATPSVPFDHSEWGQTAESFADESMDSF